MLLLLCLEEKDHICFLKFLRSLPLPPRPFKGKCEWPYSINSQLLSLLIDLSHQVHWTSVWPQNLFAAMFQTLHHLISSSTFLLSWPMNQLSLSFDISLYFPIFSFPNCFPWLLKSVPYFSILLGQRQIIWSHPCSIEIHTQLHNSISSCPPAFLWLDYFLNCLVHPFYPPDAFISTWCTSPFGHKLIYVPYLFYFSSVSFLFITL